MAPQYTSQGWIVKVYHSILSELFPSECLSCGKEGKWLCQNCEEHCLEIRMPTCPFCDRLSPLGKTCTRCRKKYSLTGCRSIWYYREAIPSLIRNFKYNKVHAAKDELSISLTKLYAELPLQTYRKVIITSVPSSPDRLRERGYNQSELLAQIVAQHVNREYRPLLRRRLDTRSQTKLTRSERFANMENQFSLRQPVEANSLIVIIDDVFTTGATLTTCAEVLKQAGAKSVWGITVAKD